MNDKFEGVTLTIKQIMDLADFAGLSVTDEGCGIDLDTEFTISEGKVAADDDKTKYYDGVYVYCTEYPEEGCLPLNDNLVTAELVVLEDFCNE